jgi:hypothetical protein
MPIALPLNLIAFDTFLRKDTDIITEHQATMFDVSRLSKKLQKRN